jgi:hypothetical protein
MMGFSSKGPKGLDNAYSVSSLDSHLRVMKVSVLIFQLGALKN